MYGLLDDPMATKVPRKQAKMTSVEQNWMWQLVKRMENQKEGKNEEKKMHLFDW